MKKIEFKQVKIDKALHTKIGIMSKRRGQNMQVLIDRIIKLGLEALRKEK